MDGQENQKWKLFEPLKYLLQSRVLRISDSEKPGTWKLIEFSNSFNQVAKVS